MHRPAAVSGAQAAPDANPVHLQSRCIQRFSLPQWWIRRMEGSAAGWLVSKGAPVRWAAPWLHLAFSPLYLLQCCSTSSSRWVSDCMAGGPQGWAATLFTNELQRNDKLDASQRCSFELRSESFSAAGWAVSEGERRRGFTEELRLSAELAVTTVFDSVGVLKPQPHIRSVAVGSDSFYQAQLCGSVPDGTSAFSWWCCRAEGAAIKTYHQPIKARLWHGPW